MAIKIFGLTGGIGSGKSTVAARFRQRGLPVIDADVLARDAVAPGTPGFAAVVDRFGAAVVTASGGLDRGKLAAIVFSDAAARADLNGIVHPIVRTMASSKFGELERVDEPLACYEVPLLYEVGLDAQLEPVVVVTADLETRTARTMARDSVTRESVLGRMAAQMPLEDKVRRAAYVVDNSGPLADTYAGADAALDAICARFGLDPANYRG